MRSIMTLLARNSPRILKKLILPTFLTTNYFFFHSSPVLNCLTDPLILSQTITSIENNIIRIELNGDLVGQAYCFSENYLVSVSYQLQEHNGNHKNDKKYDFYQGDKKLEGKFNIIGHFQNLTFLKHSQSSQIRPLPYSKESSTFLISPIQTFKKGEYPSIKNGYFVAKDSGFGIVDGRGEIGCLVIKDGKAAGIVTQVGRDLQSGFLRMIEWHNLDKILNHLKKRKQPHFGISAQAQQFKEGVEVVRISPNSPLKADLMMGDTILKANSYKIRQVEALQRICALSDGQLTLQIIRQDIPMSIKVRID